MEASKAGMVGDLLWPTLADDEAIKRHLPEGFEQLSPELKDHAYVVADLKAKNPGKILEEIGMGMDAAFYGFLGVLGGSILIMLVLMAALSAW